MKGRTRIRQISGLVKNKEKAKENLSQERTNEKSHTHTHKPSNYYRTEITPVSQLESTEHKNLESHESA